MYIYIYIYICRATPPRGPSAVGVGRRPSSPSGGQLGRPLYDVGTPYIIEGALVLLSLLLLLLLLSLSSLSLLLLLLSSLLLLVRGVGVVFQQGVALDPNFGRGEGAGIGRRTRLLGKQGKSSPSLRRGTAKGVRAKVTFKSDLLVTFCGWNIFEDYLTAAGFGTPCLGGSPGPNMGDRRRQLYRE